MSAVRLVSIQDLGSNCYAVTLADDQGGRRSFRLTVDDSIVPVVPASDELLAACHLNVGALKPVFQAVLDFHAASRMELDIDLATR
ncbi:MULTISPECIES: hypothetical protein [Amycolatopsis]|uniref:Uncharacterized protein n=1 Tax=Amycolatopsis bullii TaxID=941987 RepID=A0ABQ3KIV8_9PSEU|nr:hypothetical protein [Amycolatopsis bullii]GHG29998.1 hypothetical protein GCM10017567_57290 [Amycolatopsis bullii]